MHSESAMLPLGCTLGIDSYSLLYIIFNPNRVGNKLWWLLIGLARHKVEGSSHQAKGICRRGYCTPDGGGFRASR